MKKKRISQETLNLAILTLITILVWAGFDIYRAYTKTTVKPDVRSQLTPLDPKLDTEIIRNLERQKEIPLEEIGELPLEEKETEETKETEEGAIPGEEIEE